MSGECVFTWRESNRGDCNAIDFLGIGTATGELPSELRRAVLLITLTDSRGFITFRLIAFFFTSSKKESSLTTSDSSLKRREVHVVEDVRHEESESPLPNRDDVISFILWGCSDYT